jgi:hypothetical protein
MAQAKRSAGSGSSSSSRKSASKRTSGSPRSGSQARKSSSSRKTSSKASTASKASSGPAAAAAGDPRVEAAAQRLRKLNERIIEAGKTAGEGALTNYEKALKTIASTLDRGPGSSDVEWISSLATAQANFIRDVTEAWTKAARDMLK